MKKYAKKSICNNWLHKFFNGCMWCDGCSVCDGPVCLDYNNKNPSRPLNDRPKKK